MIISITGDTRGIGLALKNHFMLEGHTVIGFSRSNGYDINKLDDRNRIILESSSSDIFINNAYAPLAQTELLKMIISSWENTNKTIININSKTILIPTTPDYMLEYVNNKKEQSKIISNRFFKARPHIINFITSIVDTEMSTKFISKKINPNHLAKFINTLIEYKELLSVQEILVEVTDLDWKDIFTNK